VAVVPAAPVAELTPRPPPRAPPRVPAQAPAPALAVAVALVVAALGGARSTTHHLPLGIPTPRRHLQNTRAPPRPPAAAPTTPRRHPHSRDMLEMPSPPLRPRAASHIAEDEAAARPRPSHRARTPYRPRRRPRPRQHHQQQPLLRKLLRGPPPTRLRPMTVAHHARPVVPATTDVEVAAAALLLLLRVHYAPATRAPHRRARAVMLQRPYRRIEALATVPVR